LKPNDKYGSLRYDNLMTTFDNLLEVASLVFIGVLTT